MIRLYRILKTMANGHYVHLPTLAAKWDGLSEETIRSEIESSLVDEGVAEQFLTDYYVFTVPDPEKTESDASRKLQSLGNRLFSMADTRTEVEISGTAVENRSFKTDKSLGELIN